MNHRWLRGIVLVAAVATRAPLAYSDETAQIYRLAVWPTGAPTPTFNLLDEAGHSRTPRDYLGSPFTVVFGFTQCPDVCPAELLKLSLAIKQAGAMGKGMRVLFITLDPTHDSPAILRSFLNSFDAHFEPLTGTEKQIGAAADSFHIGYAFLERTDRKISHGSAVYIFNAHGKLALVGSQVTSVADYVHDFQLLDRSPL